MKILAFFGTTAWAAAVDGKYFFGDICYTNNFIFFTPKNFDLFTPIFYTKNLAFFT